MAQPRRGMLIKNVSEKPLSFTMETREVNMTKGEEIIVSAKEVKDNVLRNEMQLRTIAVVRPATDEEERALQIELNSNDN